MTDNFVRIGTGFVGETKKGTPKIGLRFDDNAFEGMEKTTFLKGIYLFPDKNNSERYTVMANMKESFVPSYNPAPKKKEESDLPF